MVIRASNGHSLVSVAAFPDCTRLIVKLGSITGSGCMTGTLVATFCAAARLHYLAQNDPFEPLSELVQGDMLLGALAGYVRPALKSYSGPMG